MKKDTLTFLGSVFGVPALLSLAVLTFARPQDEVLTLLPEAPLATETVGEQEAVLEEEEKDVVVVAVPKKVAPAPVATPPPVVTTPQVTVTPVPVAVVTQPPVPQTPTTTTVKKTRRTRAS